MPTGYETPVSVVSYKIHFILHTSGGSIFISYHGFHASHIYLEATDPKLVVVDILHKVRLLDLPEAGEGVSQSHVSEIILGECVNVLILCSTKVVEFIAFTKS